MSLTLIDLERQMLNSLKLDSQKLKKEFDKIASRNPYLSREKIAKKMIHNRAWKCAQIGFWTSFIGWATIIIPLLIDIILSTRMEAEMIYLIAYSYGYKPDNARLEPLKNYILSEIPPEGEALRKVVQLETTDVKKVWEKKRDEAIDGTKIELGQEIIKQTFQKVVKSGRKTASKTAKRMLIKVITRSITKIIPIIGAIVGYILNDWSAKRTGRLAQEWLERLDELEYNTDNII